MSLNYNHLANSTLSAPTHVSDRFIGVQDERGRLVYKQADYFNVADKKAIVAVQSKSNIPSDLSNAVIDYELSSKTMDVVDFLNLELNLVAGATGAFNSSPIWLNRMDLIGPNGNVLYSTHGQEIYQAIFLLDKNTYAAFADTMDLNATTYAMSATSYNPAATARINIPIFGFFKSTRFPLCCLQNGLTVRFYFNPSSMITTGTFTCSSQQLYVHGRRLKQEARKELIDTFWNGRVPVSLSHTSVDRMQITQTLAASTQYEFTLQGIRGHCAFMTITVRLASTANTTAPVTYLLSSGLDILDANGNSLCGAVNRNRNIQKIHYASVLNNDALVQTGLNLISWSADPRGAFALGQSNGFCIFTGNEVLRLTTGSTTTSASHLIDIRAYMMESVVYLNGELKAVRD